MYQCFIDKGFPRLMLNCTNSIAKNKTREELLPVVIPDPIGGNQHFLLPLALSLATLERLSIDNACLVQ